MQPTRHHRTLTIALLAAIVALITTTPAHSQSRLASDRTRQLRRSVEHAYQRHDWLTAAHLAAQLHEVEPDDGHPAFIAACANASAGDTDLALEWLTTAGQAGYSRADDLDHLPCFDALRDSPEFHQATEKIQILRDERFEQFVQLADLTEPKIAIPPRLDPDEPAPLIIALHGAGGSAQQFSDPWRSAASQAGAIIVAPNALRRFGSGYSWDYYDEAEYLVFQAIRFAQSRHPIDEQQIVLHGFSQGASMALRLTLRHPDRFKGVIALAPPWRDTFIDAATDPPAPPDPGPRFYLMVGQRDRLLPDTERAYELLREHDYTARLKHFPNLGHSFPAKPTTDLLRALRFVLRE